MKKKKDWTLLGDAFVSSTLFSFIFLSVANQLADRFSEHPQMTGFWWALLLFFSVLMLPLSLATIIYRSNLWFEEVKRSDES